MFKIEIKLNNVLTNYGEFQTEALCNEWIIEHNFIDTHEVIITDITAEILAKKESYEALQYLNQTDYLIIREMDCGVSCPVEIKQLRAAARLKVL